MFIVEGNIGAGKSTFLKLIQEHLSYVAVVFEPIHNWQSNQEGQSLLSSFYQQPQRWAYSMETLAMACRVTEHLKEQQHTSPFRLIERSIYSGHYCFAYNDYQSGFLTQLEWTMYNSWFNFLIPNHCTPPRGFIYLKVAPEVASARIQKRKRSGESGIPLEYLQQIDTCHEQFLVEKAGILPSLQKIPVLILDCNEEFEKDPELLKKHIQAVAEFMQATL
ncbi:deoxynucleoside kinase [Candidatus Dependentiae bacterium]|nr:deoxynucleoside kinase [Candidatus Dependentiae bacterium]